MTQKMTAGEAKIREDICILAKSLFDRGYGCGASGNVSVLTEAGISDPLKRVKVPVALMIGLTPSAW